MRGVRLKGRKRVVANVTQNRRNKMSGKDLKIGDGLKNRPWFLQLVM